MKTDNLSDGDKQKIQEKIDTMKQKRAGKTQTLNVTISDKPDMNFHHCLEEIRQLLEMHKLIPDEANALSAQIAWMAQQAKTRIMITNTLNQFMNPAPKTHEDKVEEKLEKEKEEGIVRVKPGDDIEVQPKQEEKKE